jgi:hypothetical protein
VSEVARARRLNSRQISMSCASSHAGSLLALVLLAGYGTVR